MAFAQTFADWKDYALLGLPFNMAKNLDGRMMCRSADGEECFDIRALKNDQKLADVAQKIIVCSERKNSGAWPRSRQWCNSDEIGEEVSGYLSTDSPNFTMPYFYMLGHEHAVIVIDSSKEVPDGIETILSTLETSFAGPAQFSSIKSDLLKHLSLISLERKKVDPRAVNEIDPKAVNEELISKNNDVIVWANNVATKREMKLNDWWAGLELRLKPDTDVEASVQVFKILKALPSVELKD
ncbi:hypothetical protein ABE85_06770 [Mitsuaria sp. 7]|nr:hypothetical protein ABE85_06770 [Mitsuaria sp. 7]